MSALARVRAGETLRAVALAYGVSTQTLSWRNRTNDTSVTVFGPRYYIVSVGANGQRVGQAPLPWAPDRNVARVEMPAEALAAQKAAADGKRPREAAPVAARVPVGAPLSEGVRKGGAPIAAGERERKRAVSRVREGREAVAPPAAKRRKAAH